MVPSNKRPSIDPYLMTYYQYIYLLIPNYFFRAAWRTWVKLIFRCSAKSFSHLGKVNVFLWICCVPDLWQEASLHQQEQLIHFYSIQFLWFLKVAVSQDDHSRGYKCNLPVLPLHCKAHLLRLLQMWCTLPSQGMRQEYYLLQILLLQDNYLSFINSTGFYFYNLYRIIIFYSEPFKQAKSIIIDSQW